MYWITLKSHLSLFIFMLKFRLWLTRLFCMFCTVSLHKSSVDFRRSWTLPPVWSSVHRCWQKQTHHAGPARRASLAPSATLNTVQNSNLCIWLCPWALSCLLQQRLHPSRQHYWSGKSLFGRSHDMLVLSARTQLGRQSLHVAGCSPNRLECTSITAPLIIH